MLHIRQGDSMKEEKIEATLEEMDASCVNDDKDKVEADENPSQEYKCNNCDKVFDKKASFRRHQIAHTDKYQCTTCGKGFSDQKHLSIHQNHEENCLKYMKSLMDDGKSSLDGNKAKSTPVKPVPVQKLGNMEKQEDTTFCDVCQMDIVNRNYSRHTEGMVHKEFTIQKQLGVLDLNADKFSCRFCSSIFEKRKNFSKHLQMHSRSTVETTEIDHNIPSEKIASDYDESDYNEINQIQSTDDHSKTPSKPISNGRKYCDVCQIDMVINNYSRHIDGLVHKEFAVQKQMGILNLDSDRYTCSTCSITLKHRYDFSRHLGTHVKTPTPNENQNPTDTESMESEMVKEDGSNGEGAPNTPAENEFNKECELCHCVVGQTPIQLKRHMDSIVHKELALQKELGVLNTDGKSFSCRHCTSILTNRVGFANHLAKHRKVDEGKQESVKDDNTSNENVTMAQALEGAINTADDMSDMSQCQVCDKYFASKDSLNTHMETHEQKMSGMVPDLIMDTKRYVGQ